MLEAHRMEALEVLENGLQDPEHRAMACAQAAAFSNLHTDAISEIVKAREDDDGNEDTPDGTSHSS
jgi:hypothetical protein